MRTYNAQNGAEVRLLYGSKRTNVKLQLSYSNVADTVAADFLTHFDETKGERLTLLSSRLMRERHYSQAGAATQVH